MKKLLIAFLFVLSLTTQAFKLMPMSYSIVGGGKNNTALFTVQNDSSEPLAIQLEVKVRQMDLQGKEKHPETDDFLVFPDQLILGAKKRRVIKVKWLKGEIKDVEKAFRLVAEQLPIDVKKNKRKGSDIKILLRYVAALYVTPKDKSTKIEVFSAKTSSDLKSIDLTLSNTGPIHKVLLKPRITIVQEKKEFPVKTLEGIKGENILALSKRSFKLVPPRDVNIQKPYKVLIVNDK